LNDYEGIPGYEAYRGDLALMYFPLLDTKTGRLTGLRMTPMQMRRFQLRRASQDDARWLQQTLNRESSRFGVGVSLASDGTLTLG
jgi:poly-gamma-glutamate synthesis protein (capsule biosynthesis protein)